VDIYVATGNAHKLEELREALKETGVTVCAAADAGGMPDVVETGKAFEDNALLKAQALGERLPEGAWALADDSGLEVDALDGAPGVRSARFAGEEAGDAENNALLLKKLADLPAAERGAQFTCVLALTGPGGAKEFFRGMCRGQIRESPKGENGFGYDPLFTPHGHDRTFAEMTPDEKRSLGHRGHAVRALAEYLARREECSGGL